MDRDERVAGGDERARVGAGGGGLPEGDDGQEADDAGDDDGGFQDPSGDETEPAASLCRLTGNSTTAVPIQAKAQIISRKPPQSTPVSGPAR
ncbi:hypothetical protein [Nonomuraea sp. NPDC049709]|uniref:hypothetical protein n=1 Tax=Nonomuraea sp. NPDC049709 TaxID=3154736 RepID=UPI00341E3D87